MEISILFEPFPNKTILYLLKVLLPCQQCGYMSHVSCLVCAVCGDLVMEPRVSLLSAAAVTTQSSGGREAGHSHSGDHELQPAETLAH